MVIGALLAVAAAQAVAAPVPELALRPGETLLQVEEEGEAGGVPDVATLTASVGAEGRTGSEALRAAGATMQRVVSAATRVGLTAGDLRTERASVRPRYRRDGEGDRTDQVTGYQAGTRLTLRVRDVALLPRLFDALAAAGATELDGPLFSFADERPLRARARRAAIEAAAAEADDYASATGKRIARMLRISERRVDGGDGREIVVTGGRVVSLPMLPGERKVRTTVWVDYALVDR